ncbi:MAG: hypothetical protein QOG89_3306 [Thermomicrobiales bacterium]|nr:hypothetical protein [Thermomicrobiales bacterium]
MVKTGSYSGTALGEMCAPTCRACGGVTMGLRPTDPTPTIPNHDVAQKGG